MQANEWGALIDRLAAKLAVPAEQLWAVLLRQAQVEAWLNLLWAIVLIGGMAVVAVIAHRWTQRLAAEDQYFDPVIPYIPLTIGGAAVVGIGLMFLHSAVIAFANPQFAALKFILDAAR